MTGTTLRFPGCARYFPIDFQVIGNPTIDFSSKSSTISGRRFCHQTLRWSLSGRSSASADRAGRDRIRFRLIIVRGVWRLWVIAIRAWSERAYTADPLTADDPAQQSKPQEAGARRRLRHHRINSPRDTSSVAGWT
jgi:hypothetical protein